MGDGLSHSGITNMAAGSKKVLGGGPQMSKEEYENEIAKVCKDCNKWPCMCNLAPVIKDTNPKDAVGIRKAPVSTIPGTVVAELGIAMLEGARKYGRHNYRVAGVRASVYRDAVWRHMNAWWEGEDIDSDSGLSHITKAIASLTVLRDAMIRNNWVDDRPPKSLPLFFKKLNDKAGEVIDKYPDAKEPFMEKSNGDFK